MYKIQFLLILTLLGPVALFAQLTANGQAVFRGSITKTIAPANLTNAIQSTRQPVFTAHLLTGQVEPGKKHAYDGRIGGQKVSLPYPIPCQVRNQWP